MLSNRSRLLSRRCAECARALVAGIALVTVSALATLSAQQESARFQVKYRSIDRIYLDGGRSQGLVEGTILILEGRDSTAVQIRVFYASENSASCEIISGTTEIKRGDWLVVLSWGVGAEPASEGELHSGVGDTPSQSASETPEHETARKARTSSTRTSGSLSLQWYSWQDNTAANLDFDQSTFRLNLRADELWGRPWSFRVRSRGQYDQRNRDYGTGAPDNEFVSRLYEASAKYGAEGTRFEFQLGRILPRRLARVGYLDGATVDLRPTERWHTGVLAGVKPRWQFRQEQTTLQKYGAYVGIESGGNGNNHFEQYVALVGEYHGSNISREFSHIRGRLQSPAGWGVSHQVDVDLNRGWRMEKAETRAEITNVYLNARYRLSKAITVGATYDSRQNYWTYEQQTTADSLFDDELRRGVRGNISLRLPYQVSLRTQIGFRDNASDEKGTVSYSTYLSKSNIFTPRTLMSARYSAFDGPTSDGYSYSLRLDQDIQRAVMLGVGYGAYSYTSQSTDQERISRWWEGDIRIDLPFSLFTHGRYQHSYGDDIDGNTIQLELGKRF